MTEAHAAGIGPHRDGPDEDGFHGIVFGGDGHNVGYGRMLARGESDAISRVRFDTGRRAANVLGAVHGGFMLSCLDQAIFIGPVMAGRLAEPGLAVTLGLATQFLSPGRIDLPLDCIVEIVSETGKLMFLRGQMEQDGQALLTWQATLRKIGRRPS